MDYIFKLVSTVYVITKLHVNQFWKTAVLAVTIVHSLRRQDFIPIYLIKYLILSIRDYKDKH